MKKTQHHKTKKTPENLLVISRIQLFSLIQGELSLEHPVTLSIKFKTTCSLHHKNLISHTHCPVIFWLFWTEITLILKVQNPCSHLSRCLILGMEKAPN